MSGDGHPIPDEWLDKINDHYASLSTGATTMDIETRLKAVEDRLESLQAIQLTESYEHAKRLAALEAKAQPSVTPPPDTAWRDPAIKMIVEHYNRVGWPKDAPVADPKPTPAQPSRVGRFYRHGDSESVLRCVEDNGIDGCFVRARGSLSLSWANMTEVRRVETWEPVV